MLEQREPAQQTKLNGRRPRQVCLRTGYRTVGEKTCLIGRMHMAPVPEIVSPRL